MLRLHNDIVDKLKIKAVDVETYTNREFFLGAIKDFKYRSTCEYFKYSALIKEKSDIICLGYDQKFFTDSLPEKLRKRGINPKIIRLKAFKPQIYKTSKIAKKYLYSLRKK